MADLRAAAGPVLSVGEDGRLEWQPRSRGGFAELLDINPPPARFPILPLAAPTAIGFVRTGQALRDALIALRAKSAER